MAIISSRKVKNLLFLGIILGLAMLFRFIGVNWDQGNHLHPDERFLTMVGNAMKIPASLTEYLNPEISTLNPRNVGYKFFVYGTLPLTLNKLIAVNMDMDNYSDFTVQGRRVTAFFDCLIVLLVYAIAKTLTKKYQLNPNLPLWSAFIYTVMVLPIQLAHFLAVDTYLTAFMTASIYFSLKFAFEQKWHQALLGGIAFGLAMACKINAMFVLPLALGLMMVGFSKKTWVRTAVAVLIFILGGYLSWRLADPTIFRSANILSPRLNENFLENFQSLKNLEGKETWFPPAIQWITKLPIWFAFKNMTVLGVGLLPMILIMIGVGLSVREIKNNRGRWVWLLFLGWIFAIFLFQSTQFVKALRYFIYLYPLLAILGGMGASIVTAKGKWTAPFLIIGMLIWPLMFMSIYVKPHSRVQASAWILQNIPENSTLLSEIWDDGLPVSVPKMEGKSYRGEQLPVFDQDTPEKWQKMNQLLQAGDYYTLTSNRGWGSIMTVPWKYPIMSQFYSELLAGKLPYQKVAEFTSYPSLTYLGIPLTLPDDWADETFTVYDHPKVIIYKLK